MRLKKTLSAIVLTFVGLILCVSAQAQRTAKATPTVANGFVIAATVTDGGAGYTTPPIVTILGGNGSGAIAITTILNGAVDKVIVQNAGYGYSGTPYIIIAAPPSPKPPFSDGLVDYYPFNGNANDESGSGYNRVSTVQNANLTLDRFGVQGRAYSFNGVNSHITTDGEGGLPVGWENFTVTAWVTCNQPIDGDGRVILANETFGAFQLSIGWKGTTETAFDRLIFHFGTSDAMYSDHLVWESGRWYQVMIRRNGNHFTLMRDGNVVSSQDMAIANPSPSGSRSLTFGYRGAGDHPWKGNIDDIRVYNRALSDQEVADLYAYEAPEQPWVSINVKIVEVTMHVKPTKKYQLEASLDLKIWTKAGTVFTATASEVTQQFNVIEVGRYFRLSEMP